MTQRRAKSAGGSSGGESPGSSASSRTRRLRNKPNDAIVEEEDEEYDEEPTADPEGEVDDGAEEEDEEEDENTGEVTRCICGHQEVPQQAIKNSKVPVDVGLFIQCESCQVWQHGFCVGFMSEEEVPDVYHCEKCKPERHLIVVRPGAKTSTYYPNGAPEPTWEPLPSLDEKQPRKKQPTERAKEKRPVRTKSPTPETPEKTTKNGTAAMSMSKKRRITMNSRDAAYEETLKRVLEESTHDLEQKLDLKVEGGEEAEETRGEENDIGSDKKRRSPEPEERVTKRARRTPKSRKASDEDTEAPVVSETPASLPPPSAKAKASSTANGTAAHSSGNNSAAKESTPSKKKRPKSKKATPRQNASNADQQQSTESKPRIPPPRATIPEMRKRVAAILEFVARTQGDAAKEYDDRRHLLEERNTRYQLIFSETAQPDDSKFQSMFEKYTAKHDKLADLSQKLVMWEKNFGSYDPNAEDE